MTASLNSKIRIISYNCRGWKSASNFVFNLLNDCDICMIQEHWLFKEQLQSLNIGDEYSSTAVSGMVSTEFVTTINKKILCYFTYLLLNVDPVDLCLSTYQLWFFSKS